MTGDAVRQLLAEISERAETAAEGPWEALPQFNDYELVGSDRSTVCRLDSTTETVEFIAAARSDVPRLVAALTGTPEKPGVLDLHKFSETENCCAECEEWWPCPTYRAVAAALQEQP